MNTHFGRELGQRLFQHYGSRDQWPENLPMAAASLQLLQQYLGPEAFEALMTCANGAHQDLQESRARSSKLRIAMDQAHEAMAAKRTSQKADMRA